MTGICRWWTDHLTATLEPAEQEAVRGDLAESGATGWPTLRDVLGLVIRRQAAAWKDWRPWVALVFLVVPIGYLLGFGAFALAGTVDLNVWLLQNYRDINQPGFALSHTIPTLIYHLLSAVSRASIVGYVLAQLSRRALGVNAALLTVVVVASEILTGPRYRFYMAGIAYTSSLSLVILPLVLIAVMILPAAAWGMRYGLRRTALPLAWMIPVALVIPDVAYPFPRMSPVALVLEWPALYVVAVTVWQLWRTLPAYAGARRPGF